MKKIYKIIYLLSAVAILVGTVGVTSMAQTDKRSVNIKSKGNFDFDNGKAVIYSSDLTYLADEIDLLEETYKTETVSALNQIGTYYRPDGTTTFDAAEGTLQSSDACILSFRDIVAGIINSQNIPTERTYSGTLPGENTEISGNISAAIADNLSLGTAAWVDGKLIVGNGADSKNYYSEGYDDGLTDGKHSILEAPGEFKAFTDLYRHWSVVNRNATSTVTLSNQTADPDAYHSIPLINEDGGYLFAFSFNAGRGSSKTNYGHESSNTTTNFGVKLDNGTVLREFGPFDKISSGMYLKENIPTQNYNFMMNDYDLTDATEIIIYEEVSGYVKLEGLGDNDNAYIHVAYVIKDLNAYYIYPDV